MGNTKLRPEFAKQYNFGFTYDVKPSNLFKRISFTADAYYNEVNDKILALPRLNLFQWSAQNIGRVSIKGVDVALHTVLTERKSFIVSADATYTFQNAIDVTDAGSTMYKTQLPYTPKHNGGATINVLYKQFTINYNLLFSSLRYRAGDQIFENVLQPFTTSDFSFSYLTNKKDHFNYKLILGCMV